MNPGKEETPFSLENQLREKQKLSTESTGQAFVILNLPHTDKNTNTHY